MKKALFLLAGLAVLFAACDSDPTSDESDALLSALKDNQATMFGQTALDINPQLAVRPAKTEGEYVDVGAHYLDINAQSEAGALSGRFDLGTPLMGKTIDLAKLVSSVGDVQFSFGVSMASGAQTAQGGEMVISIDVFEGESHCWYNLGKGQESFESPKSCFKSGKLSVSHTEKDGFTLTAHGVLQSGDPFAIKVKVPEKDVDYWRNN